MAHDGCGRDGRSRLAGGGDASGGEDGRLNAHLRGKTHETTASESGSKYDSFSFGETHVHSSMSVVMRTFMSCVGSRHCRPAGTSVIAVAA